MRKVEGEIENKEVRESLMTVLDETLKQCDYCENRVHQSIKIANCVLTKEEYYELLSQYQRFENNFGILESLSAQVTELGSILQAMPVAATLKEVRSSIDELVNIMEKINFRIDVNKINLTMAQLMEELVEVIEYDAIEYETLERALNSPFIVLKTLDVLDKDYRGIYYPLNVLKIESFDSKMEAYQYALSQGIRKEYIIKKT